MGAQGTNKKSTEELVTSRVPQRIAEGVRKWVGDNIILATILGILFVLSLLLFHYVWYNLSSPGYLLSVLTIMGGFSTFLILWIMRKQPKV